MTCCHFHLISLQKKFFFMSSHNSKTWNITMYFRNTFMAFVSTSGQRWALNSGVEESHHSRDSQDPPGMQGTSLKWVYPKTLYEQAEGTAWQPHCTLLMLLTPEPFPPLQIAEFNAANSSFSDCCRRFSTMQGSSSLCSHCMNNIKGRNWTSLTQQSVNWRPD